MATENDDSVNELITRYLAGETSADEESRLLLWISRSDENRRRYNDLKKTFDLTTSHLSVHPQVDAEVNVDQEWNHFQMNLANGNKTRQLTFSGVWLKIAASVILLAVTGAILWFLLNDERRVHETADNVETITLPDGSEVTLNRWSTLSYTDDFVDGPRTLSLDGEAFFEVTPDASNPFVVNAGVARIQVIGTSFNVLAYDTMKAVEVIVETGIVSLEPARGTTRRVEVLPGEKGIMSKVDDELSIVVNEDLNFLSWNTQHLVFVDSDLVSVLRALEKTYHVKISIDTDIPPLCIVTVTFDKQSLESVMRVLENTLNLKYTIEGNKVVITEAGC